MFINCYKNGYLSYIIIIYIPPINVLNALSTLVESAADVSKNERPNK